MVFQLKKSSTRRHKSSSLLLYQSTKITSFEICLSSKLLCWAKLLIELSWEGLIILRWLLLLIENCGNWFLFQSRYFFLVFSFDQVVLRSDLIIYDNLIYFKKNGCSKTSFLLGSLVLLKPYKCRWQVKLVTLCWLK